MTFVSSEHTRLASEMVRPKATVHRYSISTPQLKMALASRELPVPSVTRISNLNQGHATLLHAWNKLWRPAPAPPACESPEEKREYFAQERRQLRQWLGRWEQAFAEYLAASMTSMGAEDLTQSRVLKANHLTCTILASDAGAQPHDFDAFEAEFHAIVELADAILQARQTIPSPQSASTTLPIERGSPTSGLDVQAPLYVVLARCSNRVIWDRANRLSLQSRGL